MSDTAFDTLDAARRLKAAGIEAEQAEAIVEVMGQSVDQLVTVERFDAGIATLRAEIARLLLISVGIVIAANALMMAVLGVILTGAASL